MSHQDKVVAKLSEQLMAMEDHLRKTIQVVLGPKPLSKYVRKVVFDSTLHAFQKSVINWETDMTAALEEAREDQNALNVQLKALQTEKEQQIQDLAEIDFKSTELDARKADVKKREDMLAVNERGLQDRQDLLSKYEAEVDQRISVARANTVNVNVNDLIAKIEAGSLRSRHFATSPPIPHGHPRQAPAIGPQTMAAPVVTPQAMETPRMSASIVEELVSSSSIGPKRLSQPVTPARDRESKRQRFDEPQITAENTMEAFDGEMLTDPTTVPVINESIGTRFGIADPQGSPRQRSSRQRSMPRSLQADRQADTVVNATVAVQESAESSEPLLSTAMQNVFDQLVLPGEWITSDINAFKKRLIDTENAEKRDQPVLVLNSLANQPRSRNWESHGASCWTSKLKRFESRKLAASGCESCSTANVKCVYAEYVDGVVTNKGTWKDGDVVTKEKKPYIETV